MAEILRIEDLSVGYGKKEIVSEINQRILKGQFVSLIGPNGSGKTTILKTLTRLVSPLGGSVYIDGKGLMELTSNEIAKKVAVVLTDRPNPGLLTGFEFVSLGRYPHTGLFGRLSEKDKSKIYESLILVHAEHLADRYFGELSDGEKQKLILARAIAQDPEVIFLDEPTLYLDLKNRIEILTILHELSKKKEVTVIASLHDIDLALKISDIVCLIGDGKVIEAGPPEKIIDERKIVDLYELKGIYFNNILYSIEPHITTINSRKNFFVIAGAGTGAPIYRFLIKQGYKVITGIIHENDIDYHIAKSTGAKIISERSFKKIKRRTIKKAVSYLRKVDFVIDTGFPIGSENIENLTLIQTAIKLGKKVFSFRKRHEVQRYFKNLCEYLNCLDNISLIFEKIEERR